MPGMSQQSIDLTNALVVAAFRHSLLVSAVLWLLALGVGFLVLLISSRLILRFNLGSDAQSEPAARTYLRWIFGSLWVVDGLLQFQAPMPLGLANNVVAPMAVRTPPWLHWLMERGILLWNTHPITLAVAVAWLQIGLGLVIVTAAGRLGRFAGALSLTWAALVWLVGNGAGGSFVLGASFLFGWPGASLFYAAAGAWLMVPADTFRRRFSPVTLRAVSVVLVAAALLQSVPSANFWRGGSANALASMTRFMSSVAQPHWLASLVRAGGAVAAQMGGGFNLAVIVWLLVCAVGLWRAPRDGSSWPVWTFVAGCVLFWLVSEDTALFGGLATDVNSLVPAAVLVGCAAPRLARRGPRSRRLSREAAAGAGAVVATFAAAMVLFAGASMVAATVAGAETTLFEARNGLATGAASPAPPFHLTDQFGRPYALGEHPGRVTLLTFLDPHCWTDCPLLAQQLKLVRSQLAPNAPLDIVAVAVDPYHERVVDLRGFIARRHLASVRNFYFVTGRLAQLRKVWAAYGIGVTMAKGAKMSIHSDYFFLIGPRGNLRWIIPDDPLATSSGQASAVAEIRGLLRTVGLS